MAVIFFSGFETGDLTEFALVSGTTGTGTALTRSGRFALTTPGTPGGRVETLHSPTLTDIGVRFAFQFNIATFTSSDTFDSIFRILQGVSNVHVHWQFQAISATQGTVRCQDADLVTRGSTTLNEGTWYLFQIAVVQSATVGTILWKVDGVEIVNVSGVNTGGTAYDRVHFRGALLTNSTGTFYHDDTIILNTSTLPGDGHCIASQGTTENETPTYAAWTITPAGGDIEAVWSASPFDAVRFAISPGAGDPLAQTMNCLDVSTIHAGTVVLEQTNITGTSILVNGGTAGSAETAQAAGQGFTPATTITIGAIGISQFVSIGNDPTDSLQIELLSGAIDGTVLATSTVHSDRVHPGGNAAFSAQDWFAPFPSQVTLTGSTEYFFRITRTGARDTTNFYQFTRSSGSVITGSSYKRDNNIWTVADTSDIAFTLFADGGVIASADTINACKVGVIATRSGGAGRTHEIRRRINGVDTDTLMTTLVTDAYFETAIFTETFANLNLVEIGGEKSGGAGGRSLTIEDCWLMVDYLAAAVAGVARRLFPLLGVGP